VATKVDITICNEPDAPDCNAMLIWPKDAPVSESNCMHTRYFPNEEELNEYITAFKNRMGLVE
jgi:hypothetical protein